SLTLRLSILRLATYTQLHLSYTTLFRSTATPRMRGSAECRCCPAANARSAPARRRFPQSFVFHWLRQECKRREVNRGHARGHGRSEEHTSELQSREQLV